MQREFEGLHSIESLSQTLKIQRRLCLEVSFILRFNKCLINFEANTTEISELQSELQDYGIISKLAPPTLFSSQNNL
jgi:hypothetical protein